MDSFVIADQRKYLVEGPPMSNTLRRIADALDVPVGDLYSPVEPLAFYEDDESTRWLLVRDAAGAVVVRCTIGSALPRTLREETVADFLCREPRSAAQRALVVLIERLLAAQLTG